LKSGLDSVRFRTARLREDLFAADRQTRLSHQLSILGQFTAGFVHEFISPLSIVTSRIEILLEERKEHEPLCATAMLSGFSCGAAAPCSACDSPASLRRFNLKAAT
jgi:signal transduction histidine kinase